MDCCRRKVTAHRSIRVGVRDRPVHFHVALPSTTIANTVGGVRPPTATVTAVGGDVPFLVPVVADVLCESP
jgi:hypothetical protein